MIDDPRTSYRVRPYSTQNDWSVLFFEQQSPCSSRRRCQLAPRWAVDYFESWEALAVHPHRGPSHHNNHSDGSYCVGRRSNRRWFPESLCCDTLNGSWCSWSVSSWYQKNIQHPSGYSRPILTTAFLASRQSGACTEEWAQATCDTHHHKSNTIQYERLWSHPRHRCAIGSGCMYQPAWLF